MCYTVRENNAELYIHGDGMKKSVKERQPINSDYKEGEVDGE